MRRAHGGSGVAVPRDVGARRTPTDRLVSIAPLRSLRSFWAAGGAPGALVRRDAQLRDRLERLAGSAPNEGALTDERPFATLLQSIDLNAVLSSEVPQRAAPVDVASPR